MRSLTRLSTDSILGAAIRAPLRLLPRSHVATVRSGINKGAKWIVGSSTHGCWLGTYEQEKQALVTRLLRPGMVVWDVGANAGFYTLAFSRLVGHAGRVYAFEPLAENVDNLLKHVRLNRAYNAHIVQIAFAERSRLTGFAVEASNAMGHISPRTTSYMIPALTADDFMAQCPEARPDFLKIDIEGAEGAFLSGAARLLEQTSPEMLLALHGEEQGHACVELLRSHGYSLFDLDGSDATPVLQERGEIHARRVSPPRPGSLADRELPAERRPAPAEREAVAPARRG